LGDIFVIFFLFLSSYIYLVNMVTKPTVWRR